MVDRILVPIDGSEESDKALMKALEIAEDEDAVLDIFHVVERQPIPYGEYPFAEFPQGWVGEKPEGPVQGYPKWAEKVDENMIEHAENYFSQALEKVNEKKSEETVTNLEIATGNPADRILDKIEKGDYDLVVMGSRGLGRVERFLLGSVSLRVKSGEDVPVRCFNKEGEEITND